MQIVYRVYQSWGLSVNPVKRVTTVESVSSVSYRNTDKPRAVLSHVCNVR